MEAPLPEEDSQNHPRRAHISGLFYKYVAFSEMFQDGEDSFILEVPRYEGQNIPGAWFIYPAESIDKEKNIVLTELFDCFSD